MANRIDTAILEQLERLERRIAELENIALPRAEYNYGCDHFCISDGELVCERSMGMTYCSRQCVLSSNRVDHELEEFIK